MKARQSAATIYKPDRTAPSGADSEPQGMAAPQYRGFVLHCLAGELPAKQRAVDAFWSKAYFEAQTPAGRQAVVQQEKEWRDAPREWI
jgi:hypothetical protein